MLCNPIQTGATYSPSIDFILKYCFTFLCLLFLFPFGLDGQDHARVRVLEFPNAAQILHDLGIDHCALKHRKGAYFEGDLSSTERNRLKDADIAFKVLYENSNDFYAAERAKYLQRSEGSSCSIDDVTCWSVPAFFELGSMMGFHTYSEILQHMNTMNQEYPALINPLTAISSLETSEGNLVYHQKITSPLGSNKKQILFTALHHAREPMSATQLLFFMYYILEQYSQDPSITYLLDNYELYFIPCVNPDGYQYNEELFNPGGPNTFGFWRKNKKDNDGDGVFDPEVDGVDLNRNYGYQWGLDNQGSSPNFSSDVYRGTAPFSEPEIAAVREFTLAHDFEIALNYHTYGDYLIFPWGYDSQVTPDDLFFRTIAEVMILQNKYTTGTGFETVGYLVNGDTDDWMYGEQTEKDKILSMTPEVGKDSDGFYPAEGRLMDICRETLWQNINAVRTLGQYAFATSSAELVLEENSGSIPFEIKRFGLEEGGAYQVIASSLHPGLEFSSADPIDYSALEFGASQTGSFDFTINDQAAYGDLLSFVVETANGNYSLGDTAHFLYLPSDLAMFDQEYIPSAENLDGWVNDGWGISTNEAFTGEASLTESPFGDYSANAFSTLSTPAIDLKSATEAEVRFRAKWAIEKGYDYIQLLATNNTTGDVSALCGLHTSTGSANLAPDAPVYDGEQNEWVLERISLNDYLGENISLSFRFVSDGFVEDDGFHLDNFEVRWDEEDEEVVDTMNTAILANNFSAINIYPNPTNNDLNIAGLPQASLHSIRLYDLSGRKVDFKIEEAGNTLKLQTKGLSGMHLLEIMSPNGHLHQDRVLFLPR